MFYQKLLQNGYTDRESARFCHTASCISFIIRMKQIQRPVWKLAVWKNCALARSVLPIGNNDCESAQFRNTASLFASFFAAEGLFSIGVVVAWLELNFSNMLFISVWSTIWNSFRYKNIKLKLKRLIELITFHLKLFHFGRLYFVSGCGV